MVAHTLGVGEDGVQFSIARQEFLNNANCN